MSDCPKQYKTIPAQQLKHKFSQIRRSVHMSRLRVVVVVTGEPMGFLLPLEDVTREIPIQSNVEISCNDFIDSFFKQEETLKYLKETKDCIYLTYHTRRVMVFLNQRLMLHLPIPVLGQEKI